MDLEYFEKLRIDARLRLLKMHYESRIGHIGGNLSCLDFLLYLYHFGKSANDQFVLSKGHSVGALYIALWSTGKLSERDLVNFHGNGQLLAGHPVRGSHEEILASTGSLGHGLPVAVGMACANKFLKVDTKVFCLCSDGEFQEGSIWEAIIFSVHHRLSNLVVVVDVNKLQGFGSVEEVSSITNLAERLMAFGCHVRQIDGHSGSELQVVGKAADADAESKPSFVLLNTTKGKGVSFMEGKLEWHYLPLSDTNYQEAIKEVKIG